MIDFDANPNGDLAKELQSIYTPLSVAKEEIWRRWNDEELRKKVEEFLGGDVPEPLRNGPKVVLARHIISPNGDLLEFLKVAGHISLDHVFFEYRDDKFVASNPDKYFLAKMRFYYDIGKSGIGKLYSLNIIDFTKYNGKIASSIETIWGEKFVDFHHRIFDEIIREHSSSEIFNISPWFKKNGGLSIKFYPYYLALFLCYGILADIFFVHKEKGFINDVLFPSLQILKDRFGIKPLIVKLFPEYDNNCDDANLNWMCYPISVAKLLPIQHGHINLHHEREVLS